MNIICHSKQSTSDMDEKSWLELRVKELIEACDGNSSLLAQVNRLKDVAA